jgi:hypothetical protein
VGTLSVSTATEGFERSDVLLRDALVEHLRKGGLDRTTA